MKIKPGTSRRPIVKSKKRRSKVQNNVHKLSRAERIALVEKFCAKNQVQVHRPPQVDEDGQFVASSRLLGELSGMAVSRAKRFKGFSGGGKSA
jgi:hypothetical protein